MMKNKQRFEGTFFQYSQCSLSDRYFSVNLLPVTFFSSEPPYILCMVLSAHTSVMSAATAIAGIKGVLRR